MAKLSSFLKRHKCPIALLMFDDNGNLHSEEYGKDEYNHISQNLLDREVMDSNYEDEVLEIWIR